MTPIFKAQVKGYDEINLSKVFDLFKSKWYYVAISMAMALIGSKLYLRYTPPLYTANSTIKVEDNKSPFQDLGFAENMDKLIDNIQTEMEILKSRQMVLAALDEMNIKNRYYNVGTLLTSDMYKFSPFEVVYESEDEGNPIPYGRMYSLSYLGGDKFMLGIPYNNEEQNLELTVGEVVEDRGFRFRIIRKPSKKFPLNKTARYQWKPIKPSTLMGRARAGLNVEQLGYQVSIIKISSKDHVPGFAKDFVNTLAQIYVQENINTKTRAADQALEFISKQLASIKEGVEESEAILENFKENKELVNVEQKIASGVGQLQEYISGLSQLRLDSIEIAALLDQVNSEKDQVLSMPLNLQGQMDPNLSSLIGGFNQVVSEKVREQQSKTKTHPKIVELEARLKDLRRSIRANVQSLERSTLKKLKYFRDEINGSRQRLRDIPETQRIYVGLMREYQVKEKIFSTLLERQAEASIARAAVVPSVRIIDRASIPTYPVSPKTTRVYILGGGMGFFIGIILVLISGFLKNTIVYREEVENLSLTPIIGAVRRSNISLKHKYPRLQIIENPKSSLSESIRAIRTNLQFISPDKKSKVISITSTVSGEGKSFITINLAGIISMLNRRVVIMDMDLRKPKLHYSFGLTNSSGISTYLVGKTELDEILISTEYENLDVITSGPIPPNPAELIQSFRMELLLMELKKKYDYILIDTPPIGLVTDGTSLLKMSDIALYVLRADYSKKSYASIPDQLAEDHKIKNLYIILNSVSQTSGGRYTGYGYKGYSSGYYSDDKVKTPWWKVWKRL